MQNLRDYMLADLSSIIIWGVNSSKYADSRNRRLRSTEPILGNSVLQSILRLFSAATLLLCLVCGQSQTLLKLFSHSILYDIIADVLWDSQLFGVKNYQLIYLDTLRKCQRRYSSANYGSWGDKLCISGACVQHWESGCVWVLNKKY